MKTNILLAALVLVALAVGSWVGYDIGFEKSKKNGATVLDVSDFDDCVGQTGTVAESYPAQCSIGGKTFTQDIGNELEKADLIKIDSPRPNAVITSPLTIKGQARGTWFFEASFPVHLYDANDKQIAVKPAMTSENWMSEDFVSYEVVLTFKKPTTKTGYLLLKNDNPSGLPENDDFLKVPVKF
ncbi:MAG: Gmad2 immunoglobulin-like domain-containing protein [Patescibacteria group bacterium]